MTSASYEAAAEDRRRASRWARDAIMVAVQEIDAYRRVAYEEDTCSLVADWLGQNDLYASKF